MKNNAKSFVAGIVLGAICASGAVFAKTAVENIEVTYDNIKVYKDNILCELKDSNGDVIEPFIYNGTTYMPVRGTASLADMQVTWDGPTKSIYLWDELSGSDGTYLLDVCHPYKTDKNYDEFLQSEGKSFSMAGKKYTNGFKMYGYNNSVLFNLDGKYSAIDLIVGHIDGSPSTNTTVSFFVDDKLVKEIDVDPDGLPQTVSIPANNGLQLKILAKTQSYANYFANIGFGNITVK